VLGDLTRRAASPRDGRPDEEYTRAFLGIGLTDTGLAGELAPLPGVREVEEIAADYGPGARVVSGAEATKDLILSQTAGYRVVHFATHGVIDDAEPLYSGLRVAAGRGGEIDDPGGDNVLRVYEMFGLALSGAVVVCSACETARGRLQAGEGLVGMSRALFYAGAIALVVALWPVPDRGAVARQTRGARQPPACLPAPLYLGGLHRVGRGVSRLAAERREQAGQVTDLPEDGRRVLMSADGLLEPAHPGQR
jgi:hypothetical protein